MDRFHEFYLQRNEDVSGVSGAGIVARGMIFPSGECVLEWQTFHKSLCIYKNIADVEAIHGHHGKTKVVMGSPADDTDNKAPTQDKPKKKKIK